MEEKDFVSTGINIVEEAEKRGITLRILGAIAIRIHCPKYSSLHKALKREFSDLDFVAYGKQINKIDRMFRDLNYTTRRTSLPVIAAGRRFFIDPTGKRLNVDIFFDKLHMNHEIDFKKRLEIDHPTIALSYLALTKLQIVKINEKDIKDMIVLLLEHEVGEKDEETINAKRMARTLASDWGFYYTVTTNLRKINSFLPQFEVLTDEQREQVSAKIDNLLGYIENEPKSLGWKLRSKIGTKKKWYDEVEEVMRAEWLEKL